MRSAGGGSRKEREEGKHEEEEGEDDDDDNDDDETPSVSPTPQQQLSSSDDSTRPKPESGTEIPCCLARPACSLAETSEKSTSEGSSREVRVRVTTD